VQAEVADCSRRLRCHSIAVMVVVVHKNFKDKETRTKKTYLHLSLGPFFSVLYPCEPAIGEDPLPHDGDCGYWSSVSIAFVASRRHDS
jgi:hypothetical protein